MLSLTDDDPLERSFISETLAGVLSGHPPLPLSAKERTGIPPLDLILRYQKSFKLSAYGASSASHEGCFERSRM